MEQTDYQTERHEYRREERDTSQAGNRYGMHLTLVGLIEQSFLIGEKKTGSQKIYKILSINPCKMDIKKPPDKKRPVSIIVLIFFE